VSGHEAEFEIRHGGVKSPMSTGRARIVYTDYRSALVYQCQQVLADGACLPSQVSVEVWSRRPMMPEIRCNVENESVLCSSSDYLTYKILLLLMLLLGYYSGIVYSELVQVTLGPRK